MQRIGVGSMAMNAHAQALVGLITSANLRFVIPVYQRPYSWDEEQCAQLWDDILYVGSRPQDRHFTGSVVWVQDGTFSASGIQPMLLIDGQQRITTLSLIIAALAGYARNHPEAALHFSYNEIMQRGYLIDTFRQGDDRYKLTLTRGDKKTLESLVENLVDPDFSIDEESVKLIENYKFFCKRIEAMEDPNIVWDGIQRLDVVSISLDANQDNPQLIFESMNSTGKDLSSADLIRNFVLMGLPKEKQDALYLNHWRDIELILGADSYEDVFDEFLRSYLTVLYAPEPLVKRDIYHIFKRHVSDHGYDKEGRIEELLREMKRFAKYYACISKGTDSSPERAQVLANLRRLDVTVVNPLLLSLYDDWDHHAFDDGEFLHMLNLVESYVFRRSICDVATNSLNKFLPSVIAKLNKIQDEGGNYVEAFESFFLLEAGTARRFPDDAEFYNALTTRDAYHYRRSFYLLANLENMHHPKNPMGLWDGNFTIEHVMPQNALSASGWQKDVEGLSEETFSTLLNNLGNLTLSSYNSELSDNSFQDKKQRYIGGYDKDYLVISDAMRRSEVWSEAQITDRAKSLAHEAENRWRYLKVDASTAEKYNQKKNKEIVGRSAIFRNIFEAGLVPPGTVLVPRSDKYSIAATVTDTGLLELPNGETFKSPSLAAIRVITLATGGTGARNGWKFWRVGSDGPVLDELRSRYLLSKGQKITSDVKSFRIAFWDGFYDYCASSESFTSCFNDPSSRADNSDAWASFGIGTPNMHISALVNTFDESCGVELWVDNLEAYEKVLPLKEKFDNKLIEENGIQVEWDAHDEKKKSRHIVARSIVNYSDGDWIAIYQWMVEWMFRIRELALAANSD